MVIEGEDEAGEGGIGCDVRGDGMEMTAVTEMKRRGCYASGPRAWQLRTIATRCMWKRR